MHPHITSFIFIHLMVCFLIIFCGNTEYAAHVVRFCRLCDWVQHDGIGSRVTIDIVVLLLNPQVMVEGRVNLWSNI